MLMPTKDRQQIYEYIFEEGVMVAKKGELLWCSKLDLLSLDFDSNISRLCHPTVPPDCAIRN